MKSTSAGSIGRVGTVIGTSYLVLGLIDPNFGVLQLPLQWLLKFRLHLNAEQLATFFSIAFLPWYFKPVAALISDFYPVFGSRRRSYLVGGGLLAALGLIILSLIPLTRDSLLPIIILIHVALMLVSTVTGGVLVEEGQLLGATGRLTSLRSVADDGAALLAAPLGGWLAGYSLGTPSAICAILAVAMAGVFAVDYDPHVEALNRANATISLPKSIAELLVNRNLWIVLALYGCYHLAPGFQTPLFFYQTDSLGFRPAFLGYLGLLSSVGGILGAVGYAWCCRRIAFHKLILIAAVVSASSIMSYLAYRSPITAIFIGLGNAVCGAFAFVALLDLVARAIPKSHEALGYALVFSFGNLISSGCDIVGSHWFDAGTPFTTFVWLKAASFGLIALAIPFLPTRITKTNH